jgi:hypothetical protein
MDVSGTFTPAAVQLIDGVFGSDITYRRTLHGGYNPATGQVQNTVTDTPIKAGIISRARSEEGGTNETWNLTLWVHHGATGLPFLPTTGDEVLYDNTVWRVAEVDPTYSAQSLIASKLVCRAPG